MSPRTRAVVMSLSAPVLAFALVGGLLGKAMAREDTYQDLKVFDDVVSMITNNYVEAVDIDKVMSGAMRGLAEGLDPDSAYLSPGEVKQIEAHAELPAGSIGLDLTRQYYLRVIAARDGSPADRAGLRTGDYVRAIDEKPTREMSVWEGMRALRGAPGTTVTLTVLRGNANEPHEVQLTREVAPAADVSGRLAAPGVGYVRIAAITSNTAKQVEAQVTRLEKAGAAKLILDLRRTSGGDLDDGLALARLFVATGTLAQRETKAGKEPIAAGAGGGAITAPASVLVDVGTTGAAELFASALSGNDRAVLIGSHTMGRAAQQTLIKLPDGSGLWLSTIRYLTPDGEPLHEKGLEPGIAVAEPDPVDFGQPAPTADPVLEKALEHAAMKQAA
ncbi:MAG: PDZ domain-containing protein [Acidobacteria bacterium]|nr:PDZ domain-containing protein [Acidobacteriota bacterium]